MEGEENPVMIMEMKCTPSMKCEVYCCCLVFRDNGTYLGYKSKCDCPNGWLFCSHTLAVFLFFRVVQSKSKWSFVDLITVMPQPTKTLQNLPVAAKMVFTGSTTKETKAIGRHIAKEVPGYSSKDDTTRPDDDSSQETEAIFSDIANGYEVKSMRLCDQVDEFIENSKHAKEIDAKYHDGDVNSDTEFIHKKTRKKHLQKVTASEVNRYNDGVLNYKHGPTRRCETLLRHNRLHNLTTEGFIISNTSLSYHLKHFQNNRKQELMDNPSASTAAENLPHTPDIAFLRRYLADC